MNPISVVDFKPLFETLPGLYLILTPGFTIVAVSDAYLKATMTEREAIVGRGLFEVFPDNPHDKYATGVSNLRTSLNAVLQLGQPHRMAEQKYDIRRPDGVFEKRYWSPLNTPVFNEAHELVYIIHNVVDVTDQHKAADKLKNSEKDYQLLVNSVKDYAIFMVDTNGLVASWNSGAESIKGYTADEIIGKPISVFYTAEDIEHGVPQSNLQRAVQHGHFEAEGWRLRKDGNLFWANIVITALKDEAGMLYGYSKITRDITARKNDLEQLESLTRQINQSNDAIFTTDINRRIISWNMGAQNLYGFTKEEVVGKDTSKILMTAITEEDVRIGLNAIAEHDYWTGEVWRKTKTGKDVYVRSSVTAIRDSKGVITGYVAVSFDITEQKKLRGQVNHLASLVEQSSEAIVSRGIDNRFISWNSGAETLFGYSKEEAIGKTPNDLRFTGLTEQEITGVSQQIIEKGSWNSEREFFHKNGSSFFGTVNANPVRNEEGKITSIVFIIKDISVRKQLEDQLKKYNVELEEEVKARTEEINKREKRFRALIENSNDLVSLMDESFKVVYRSLSTFRITGWTDEEMIHADGTTNIHPDDRDKARAIAKEFMANPGKPINCLFRNLHKNGHYIWLEGVIINLLHDEYVKAIVFNFRDVTERIDAEEKLVSSENRFRALVENNYDIITLLDESLKIIYRSPSVTRVMGFDTGEMGKLEGMENVHPDDRAYAANIIREVMDNPWKPLNAMFRRQHKNGHYIWLEGRVTNLLHDEQVKAIVGNFRDITERIEAEEKLAASEMRFRLLIENSADGIDLSDEFSNNIYRSPGAIKITGSLPKDNQRGFTHPDDVDTIKNLQEEFIKNPGVPVAFQARFRHQMGHYIWLEGTVTNLLHIAGVQAFVTNFRDITMRKEAEDALKESEAKFRNVVENIHEALIIEDKEGKLVYANTEFYRMFGYTSGKEDILSLKYYTAAESYHEVLERHNNRLKGIEVPEEFEYKGLRKDGTEIWIEARVSTIKENDKIIRTQSLVRDITERKKAEENLRYNEMSLNKAQAIAHIGNWEIDLVQNIHTWSDEFYRIYGLNKEEVQPSTQLFLSFMHPDDAAFAEKKVQEAFDSFSDSSFDFRFIHKDGITRHVYTEWKFEFDKKRKPVRLFGIIQDVTERKQAETERAKIINDLILRNKDLEQFTYIVSHNLRAPLANILGAGTRLNDPRLSSDKRDTLSRGVIESITKLDNVIKDLNNILQVKRTINETKEIVHFSKLVKEIKISIQHLFDKNNIEMKCDFSEIDEFLTLKSYLYSIFYNLISNSIKYRQHLIPGIIDIKSRLVKEKIELIFTDNGMGIDLQQKGDEVFGLYKRFHTDIEGKGMGLFMVKTQVETLGGKISIQSEVNKGTEFTIEFEP